MIPRLPTVEDVMTAAEQLKRNRIRRQELRKYMRLLMEHREHWEQDDTRLYFFMEQEYMALSKSRLELTRIALGVWPAKAS